MTAKKKPSCNRIQGSPFKCTNLFIKIMKLTILDSILGGSSIPWTYLTSVTLALQENPGANNYQVTHDIQEN